VVKNKKVQGPLFFPYLFFFSGDPVLGATHLLIAAIEMMEGHLAAMLGLVFFVRVLERSFGKKNGIIWSQIWIISSKIRLSKSV